MSRRRSGLRAIGTAALLMLGAMRASAQIPVLLEGLADGEFWATTKHSNLLTRNAGKPGEVYRVQLWGAVEPVRHVVLYAQTEVEGGRAGTENSSLDFYKDQWGVRFAPAQAFVIDVGKLQPVLGTFAPRHFSNRNPLIGAPDGYSLDYPLGGVISGELKHFDYRAGLVSLPATHEGYTPTPTARLRPAVG